MQAIRASCYGAACVTFPLGALRKHPLFHQLGLFRVAGVAIVTSFLHVTPFQPQRGHTPSTTVPSTAKQNSTLNPTTLPSKTVGALLKGTKFEWMVA